MLHKFNRGHVNKVWFFREIGAASSARCLVCAALQSPCKCVLGLRFSRHNPSVNTRSLSLALALLLSLPAAHAEWVSLGTSDADTVYIDNASVRKVGTRLRVLMLRDAGEERQTPQGQVFRSRKLYFEFDCAAGQYRVLSTMVLSGHMGSGDVLASYGDPADMQTTPTNTIAYGIQKAVCH